MLAFDPATCDACGGPRKPPIWFKGGMPMVGRFVCADPACGARLTVYAIGDPAEPANCFASASEAREAVAGGDSPEGTPT